MIPDGYDLIGDEYVRKIPTLLEKEINKHVETSIPSFFDRVGYKIKKISTTPNAGIRTVDYEYEDLGIEVTSIREYLPKNEEVDKLLRRHDQTNHRICAYMYLNDDKPKVKILDEKALDNNLSILCMRQHISCYRPKIINKINDKYTQDENHNIHVIVMDFRLAHFDSLSLKREIKTILDTKGMEYPSLGGILTSIPKQPSSDMLTDDLDYVFINNIHSNLQHDILKELNKYSIATTSFWLTINQIFIKKPSQITSISIPCFDCPEENELESMGLPTF